MVLRRLCVDLVVRPECHQCNADQLTLKMSVGVRFTERGAVRKTQAPNEAPSVLRELRLIKAGDAPLQTGYLLPSGCLHSTFLAFVFPAWSFNEFTRPMAPSYPISIPVDMPYSSDVVQVQSANFSRRVSPLQLTNLWMGACLAKIGWWCVARRVVLSGVTCFYQGTTVGTKHRLAT